MSWLRRVDLDPLVLRGAVVTANYDQVTDILGDSHHTAHHRLREEDIHWPRGVQALHGTSVAYRDAWQLTQGDEPGPTFAPSVMPLVTERWQNDLDRRIDSIFIRCTGGGGPSIRVTGCEHILDSPVDGFWGSDHFGVTADFETATGNG